MYSMPSFNRTEIKLRIISNDLIDDIVEGLNQKDKNASMSLAKSLKTVYVNRTGTVSAQFRAKDYWKYVDKGRRPGKKPPITPLVKWAKVKLGLSGDEAVSAAFGIAENIKKRGVKPTDIFSNAIAKFKVKVNTLFKNEMKVDVSKEIREVLMASLKK